MLVGKSQELSKQTSMNNVLPTEVNFLFEIFISQADQKEDTGFHTQQFLALEIARMSYLATGEKKSGKHLSGSGEKQQKRRMKRRGGSYTETYDLETAPGKAFN